MIISDLDLPDVADVATILRILAKAAEINILISPNAKATLSFTFREIPWDQAFRSVVAAAGLTYHWQGDVLRVLTMDDMKHELALEVLLKEQAQVRAERRRVEPRMLQVVPIRYSRAKNIANAISGTLSTPGTTDAERDGAIRPNISIDEENNAIILHATRDDLDKLIALIRQLDRPRQQVRIEAQIIEATRDAARQLGVQWGVQSARLQSGRQLTVGNAGPNGFNSDFPAQFFQGGSAPFGFSMGLLAERIGTSQLLDMQLSALQQRGQIQILSSPSIITLDNEAAVIESGEERAYRRSTGTGLESDVTVEWKKAVLKLEVTPSVVDGQTLRVEIIANKDSFDETKPQTNNEFPVNTKHASTTVLLRNGETVVIGGLSLESKSTTEAGIPGLMDIPGLGRLFKSKGQSRRFDETLIFITPTLLETPH